MSCFLKSNLKSTSKVEFTNAILALTEDAESYRFKQERITTKSSFIGVQSIDSPSNFQKEDRFLTKGGFALVQEEGGGDH